MTIIALGTSVQIASAKMLEGAVNQSSHITRLTRSSQLDSGATINAAPPCTTGSAPQSRYPTCRQHQICIHPFVEMLTRVL